MKTGESAIEKKREEESKVDRECYKDSRGNINKRPIPIWKAKEVGQKYHGLQIWHESG